MPRVPDLGVFRPLDTEDGPPGVRGQGGRFYPEARFCSAGGCSLTWAPVWVNRVPWDSLSSHTRVPWLRHGVWGLAAGQACRTSSWEG